MEGSYYKDGQMTRYAGFALGNTSDTTSNSRADQDSYTIWSWLGILGGDASISIIDTSLYGDIQIEFTLAPSDVFMFSPFQASSKGGDRRNDNKSYTEKPSKIQ